jgi:hypothetical protein
MTPSEPACGKPTMCDNGGRDVGSIRVSVCRGCVCVGGNKGGDVSSDLGKKSMVVGEPNWN